MKLKEIIHFLESWAHPSLQEPYDNSGLLLGDSEDECTGALITLDVTVEVVQEAIQHNASLIIAHHPVVFKGLKRIGKKHWIDKCIRLAIKHDIAIYAIHTNLDNIHTGVNKKISDRLKLKDTKVLRPKDDTLSKLTVMVPQTHKEKVLEAMFNAGAGAIGNYQRCSFQTNGLGSFQGNNFSTPAIGKKGELEMVKEASIDVLVRKQDLQPVIHAMKKSHPYEEVAFFASGLLNDNQEVGAGMIGTLQEPMATDHFLMHLKSTMNLAVIRHTNLCKSRISKVALCGGSGSFLLRNAISQEADIFITADFKYHEFFDADNRLIIADIGHYESEVFTKDLLFDELSKTFANFAFRLSKVDTNPIKYLIN